MQTMSPKATPPIAKTVRNSAPGQRRSAEGRSTALTAGRKKPALRFTSPTGETASPGVDQLVEEMISRVADKWTLLVLEALAQSGTLRFTQIAHQVGGISQKMLTQTLRQMESDGFLTRTVHPVVPPHVDYQLTPLGESLGEAFCSVWHWAEKHYTQVHRARLAYRERMHAAKV